MRGLLNLLKRSAIASGVGQGVRLRASSPAEATAWTGLIVVEYVFAATRRSAAGPAELVVHAAAGPTYVRTVELAANETKGWVALHGHLLPNGPQRLGLELRREGARLAEARVTVRVRNEGELAEAVRANLTASGTPVMVDVLDARLYDYDDPTLVAWFDRSPEEAEAHIAGLESGGLVSHAEAAALRHFVVNGYMVLPDLVDSDHLARLNAEVDDVVARKVEGYEYGVSQRIHNLHQKYPAIRELWLHPQILRMLQLVFGARALPCQSLTYVFGSEQQYHQDTIHLTPFPAGRMCGVWTAFEDVQPDSGELLVYPGSHREPRVYMHHAGAAKVVDEDWAEFGRKVPPLWETLISDRYACEVYRPKAGTVLIWHENLMHGGSVRRDREKSRRSMVGHYFADGAVVFYDSSGMPGTVDQTATAPARGLG